MTRYAAYAFFIALAFAIGVYVGETYTSRACFAFHTDLLEPVQ